MTEPKGGLRPALRVSGWSRPASTGHPPGDCYDPRMSAPALTEVRRLDGGFRLSLTWEDGATADVTANTLRGWCPCAVCQGHGASRVVFRPPSQPVRVGHIEPVGAYGISLQFSDGHATGIYRFEYLREIADSPESAASMRRPPLPS